MNIILSTIFVKTKHVTILSGCSYCHRTNGRENKKGELRDYNSQVKYIIKDMNFSVSVMSHS